MATEQISPADSARPAAQARDVGRWVVIGMMLAGFSSFAAGMALFSPRVALVVCGPLVFAGGVVYAILGRR